MIIYSFAVFVFSCGSCLDSSYHCWLYCIQQKTYLLLTNLYAMALSLDSATQQVQVRSIHMSLQWSFLVWLVLQERLKGIYKLVKQIQDEKIRNEGNLNAVIKAHEKLQSDDKISPYHKVQWSFIHQLRECIWLLISTLISSLNLKGSTALLLLMQKKKKTLFVRH